MNKLNIVFLLFVFAFCFQSAYSQCCCGDIRFSMVDKKGKPILNNRLKIKEIPDHKPSRIFFDSDKATENATGFVLGCTSGGIVSVIYKGSEMRINFKFHMDAMPKGKITFQKGDFIAEPVEKFQPNTGIIIRKATKDEMK